MLRCARIVATLCAQIGAERFRCKSSIYNGFYWGGLTAGDIPKPAVNFHDLLPLQQLVFENEEDVVELVDPEWCDGPKEGSEADFFASSLLLGQDSVR